MEEVDILVKDALIITLDEKNSILQSGYLCVKDATIVDIGHENPEKIRAKRVLSAHNGILMPGLVNGHTHVAMTLFRGLADDLPLMDWLNNYIFPVERNMDADFVYTGALLGCAEMILSGTTTFCDMYLFEDEVAEAASQAGLRCLLGEVLYDFPSPNYGTLENGFRYTEDMIKKWCGDPLISVAVEPHSLFTCSPELLKTAYDLAENYDVPIVIHVAETIQEVEQIKEKFGRRPVEYMADLGLVNNRLIADHCVHLSEEELRIMATSRASIIHNPESNMKLASGVAPVPEMLRFGINVGIGTDGCASNNNLDLFNEMDSAAKLHKVYAKDPTVMDALTIVRMATIEGARALGLGDITGSLEIGKRADFIILDMNKPHLTPIYNPYSHLVYAASGNDVSHVAINGQIVMENRQILTIDLQELYGRVREKAKLVKKWISLD